MFIYIVYSLFLLVLVKQTSTAPTIEPSFLKVVYINEGVTNNVDLTSFNCSDPDSDPTKTYLKTITPTSPCTGCFNVYKCGALECLQYRAGVGSLDYTQAASYLVTISCTDNNEAPATEVIEVVVRPNGPPEFVPFLLNITNPVNSATPPNTLIYTVSAKDPDNDTISYKLKVIPASASGHFAIDQTTGKITNLVDLRSECINDITLEVTISDGKYDVGPMVIDMPIKSPNAAPMATNLDTLIQIPEDTTTAPVVFKMILTDDSAPSTILYNVSSTNTNGLAQFSLKSCTTGSCPTDIKAAKALNYEDSSLRETDATIQLTDGYCSSPPYAVKLQVTDVNEQQNVTLTSPNIQICEGKQDFTPPYIISEPDTYDTQRWTFDPVMGNPDPFAIDQNTGSIRTLIDYEVDSVPNKNTNPVTLKILMFDKGLKSASVSVIVTFLDCNDNAPEFATKWTYTGSATECSAPGSVLTSIRATDKDSAREGNNVLYYEGSGGSVSVNDKGDVILNEPMPAGTVVTFNAYAYDRGLTPGPLRSVNPAVISIRFTPCPTTAPPAATAPPAVTAAATTLATTAASSSKKSDDNLVWIILAALLGTFFLGLLGFLLWRYGARCLDAFRNMNCDKKCCRPRPSRPLTPQRRLPLSKQPEAPVEKEPDPPGPGFLFGFWKERFPDDDFKHLPDRNRLPSPGDMESHYPHTIDPVEDPLTSQAPAADAPKKNCAVM